jgi:hypothetical protein
MIEAAMSSAWRAGLNLQGVGERPPTIHECPHADVMNAKGGNDARLQDWDPRGMAGGPR